jgi:phospholipid/cholesterol/gamma-HCH transport system substrate-binding protein
VIKAPRLSLPRLGTRRSERPAAHAQMGPGGKRLVGLATTLIAIGALALAFSPNLMPWNRQFHLALRATGFGELDQRAWVEIGGSKVGEVSSVDPSSDEIKLSIDPQYAALLHSDATASIQPHGLLGPKFVQLYPGHTGSMAEGGIIPANRVHVSTDFDQVVNALQPDVRSSLQVLLIELGKGSQGRGDDVNAALLALGRSAQNLNTASATLAARDQNISQFLISAEQFNRDVQNAPISASIADTNKVLSGLAANDQQIGDGIDQTAAVLAHLDTVLSGNEGNLSYTISRLPETVTRLRVVLAAGNTLLTGANTVDSQDGYSYNSIEALMTAVMFTESAFGRSDANGHFVNVYSITGACTLGAVPGAAPTGPVGVGPVSAGQCAGMPQHASGGQQTPQAQVVPTSTLSDQDLINLFLGGSQ